VPRGYAAQYLRTEIQYRNARTVDVAVIDWSSFDFNNCASDVQENILRHPFFQGGLNRENFK